MPETPRTPPFRAAALERLSSPERLDTLLRVVRPSAWIPLATLLGLAVATTAWAFLGRIPVTAQGRGVLVGHVSSALVCVATFDPKDGGRAEVGLGAQVEPDTVLRERFGGVVGEVREVAATPLPPETPGGRCKIQVTIALERDPDTVSGYAWSSSKGPPRPVMGGTTCSVTLRLEERAPITFVLPYLRSVVGLE